MLKGKTILITGASSGVGLGAAKALARLGAEIILLGKNKKNLECAHDEISQHSSAMICHFNLATASADDYIHLADTINQTIPKLDGLIHCASHFDHLTPLAQRSMASWQQTLQVNLNARFLISQALLPILKKASHAKILFPVNSLGTKKANALWGGFQIAEVGLHCFIEQLQHELASTAIKVCAVELPESNTAFRAKAYPFEDKSKLSSVDELDKIWEAYFCEQAVPSLGEIVQT